MALDTELTGSDRHGEDAVVVDVPSTVNERVGYGRRANVEESS